MKVIGCTGFACAGKDTFYKLLYDIDRNCVRFAFADELKAKVGPFLSSVLGWDVFNLTQEQKKIVRPLLVWLGATMRYFDKDYWVKALHQKLQETPIDLYMIPVL